LSNSSTSQDPDEVVLKQAEVGSVDNNKSDCGSCYSFSPAFTSNDLGTLGFKSKQSSSCLHDVIAAVRHGSGANQVGHAPKLDLKIENAESQPACDVPLYSVQDLHNMLTRGRKICIDNVTYRIEFEIDPKQALTATQDN